MPKPTPTQVLIVGAGPTGLTASMELSRLGIRTRIIDKRPEPATTSRAIGVQARTLEQMELRGLADAFVRLGNQGRYASAYGGGKRVFRLDFGGIDSRYPYLLFISQSETERILSEAIGAQGVTIERGVEMIGFAQDAMARHGQAVSAMLRHTDGTIEQTAADYLISAEGAHSVVRTSLDLRFEGKTLNQHYALGDLHIDGDLPETDFHIFSSEHGFMGLFPMGRQRFRLIASNPLSEPSPDAEPPLGELQAIYDQRSPIPARFHDMTWSSWFAINSRMVPRLRVGRLLLGGDSAHIHSPAGAQGMNTGIQDMMNLCWKLALVLQGRAPDKLLDTYEQDRLPVMRDVLFKTENLTGLIGSENLVMRSLFDHLGPWVGGSAIVQHGSTARMSQIALGYRDSPLSAHHGHGGPLHAGDRVPDGPIKLLKRGAPAEERRLFTLLDPSRFALLFANATDPESLHGRIGAALAPWKDLVDEFQIEAPADPSAGAPFVKHFGAEPSLLFVRPDGYIGFAGHAGDVERLADYCREWLTGSGGRPLDPAATGAAR